MGTGNGQATPVNGKDHGAPIAALYDYHDDGGELLYQKVRLHPKSFRHRRPDGEGGWEWSLGDTKHVLYHLPDLRAADPSAIVFYVEGEKDADRLRELGLVSTTSGGASDWRPEHARHLIGRHVVVLPDNDVPGYRHAEQVAGDVLAGAASVKVVALPGLPPKGDVSDWLDAGHDLADLLAEVNTAPRWIPDEPAPPREEPTPPVDGKANGHPVVWADRLAIVNLIRARSTERWISIGLGTSEIVEVRAGGTVSLMGPTGAGKSSLAAGIILRHAREDGWALILSRELTTDEMGARMIGMQLDASWKDVLKGEIPDEQMLAVLPERMRMVSRSDATLASMDLELGRLRAEQPDARILFAIDYGQIVGTEQDDQRLRVSTTWNAIDELARKHRAVALVLSQMSRAASKSARSGERLGAEALDGGAESAAIERDSTVVLEIGAQGAEDQYGRREVQLNIAKGRMGGGDNVLPMHYEGRTGRWSVAGVARPASEVKTEARAREDDKALRTAMAAIRDVAGRATEPQTQRDLIAAAGVRFKVGAAAAIRLLQEGDLAWVQRRRPRSRAWLIWTPMAAAAAGVPLASGPTPEAHSLNSAGGAP